jgi:hypothetical protein
VLVLTTLYQQRVTVHAAQSDLPTPQAWAVASAAQRREQERATRAKERKLRRWERLEQYDEEYCASSRDSPLHWNWRTHRR